MVENTILLAIGILFGLIAGFGIGSNMIGDFVTKSIKENPQEWINVIYRYKMSGNLRFKEDMFIKVGFRKKS